MAVATEHKPRFERDWARLARRPSTRKFLDLRNDGPRRQAVARVAPDQNHCRVFDPEAAEPPSRCRMTDAPRAGKPLDRCGQKLDGSGRDRGSPLAAPIRSALPHRDRAAPGNAVPLDSPPPLPKLLDRQVVAQARLDEADPVKHYGWLMLNSW